MRRPRDSASCKMRSGGRFLLPNTRSAASIFADSNNSAFSSRSVNSAIPVTEVTAITSAKNNNRSSPPRQSRQSRRMARPNRVLNALWPFNSATSVSGTDMVLIFLVTDNLTGHEFDNTAAPFRQGFVMGHQYQRGGEFLVQIKQ